MKICAVVPAFKVIDHIVNVVSGLAPYVDHVFVVDDCCPQSSGKHLVDSSPGSKNFSVIFLKENLGVGGAVIAGYKAAKIAGYDIAVKVDGDGQMNPQYIPMLTAPIISGEADYVKGNRFFSPAYLSEMPPARLVGNAALSFISKLSTGQWHIMDPTNGYTALHLGILDWIQLERVQKRYFFETDMLFWLGTIDAIVQDTPMPSIYGTEKSNLSIRSSIFEFSVRHFSLFTRRIFFSYILRNFNLASVFLLCSLPSITFGVVFGLSVWAESIKSGIPATAGTIMLAALPTLTGLQLLFGFMSFDMVTRPSRALWKKIGASQ